MNNKQLLMNYYYPIYKRSIKRLLLYFFFYNFNYNFISKYPPFLSVIEELQEFQFQTKNLFCITQKKHVSFHFSFWFLNETRKMRITRQMTFHNAH